MKRLCLAATFAAFALTGCGNDSGGDSLEPASEPESKVFRQVESQINEEYGSTTFYFLPKLSCEGKGVGADFTCDATNRYGIELEITGKIESAKNYSWKYKGKTKREYFVDFDWDVTGATISPDALEKGALEEVDRNLDIESIVCPDENVDVTERAEVECTATAKDGSEQSSEVRVSHDSGVVSVRAGV